MILNFIVFVPIMASVVTLLLPMRYFKLIRSLSLFVAISLFILSLLLWVFVIDSTSSKFQLFFCYFFRTSLNINWTLALDGLAFPFILLTTFIFPLCFLSVWKKVKKLKAFIVCLFILEFTILGAFLTNDLLFFFFFFWRYLVSNVFFNWCLRFRI